MIQPNNPTVKMLLFHYRNRGQFICSRDGVIATHRKNYHLGRYKPLKAKFRKLRHR